MGGTSSLTVHQWCNVPHLPIEALRLNLIPFGIRILCFSCRSLLTAKDHHCLGIASLYIVAACIYNIFHHSYITVRYQKYIRKKLCALRDPLRNFGAGTHARGSTYQKKNAYTRLSLSLSLSLSLLHWKRESERRGRGELDPIGSNHPDFLFWPTCTLRPAYKILGHLYV